MKLSSESPASTTWEVGVVPIVVSKAQVYVTVWQAIWQGLIGVTIHIDRKIPYLLDKND